MTMMNNGSKLLVIVANSSYAQFYQVSGCGRQIKKLGTILHPEGRIKSQDFISDKPGKTYSSSGPRTYSLNTQQSVKSHEQEVFAKLIDTILSKVCENISFDEIKIVAPPQFLGKIKSKLSLRNRGLVSQEIQRDLPQYLSEQEVINHLCKHLELWNYVA
jgi:protein required for attachment to host cells